MKTFLRFLPFALLVATLESAILARIVFLPVRPDIMLILVVFVAMKCGEAVSLSFAFVAGMVVDCVSLAPFGLHSALFLPIAFALSIMRGSISSDAFFIPCVVCALAAVAKALLAGLLSLCFTGSVFAYGLSDARFLRELCFTVLLAPLVFRALLAFSEFFKIEE